MSKRKILNTVYSVLAVVGITSLLSYGIYFNIKAEEQSIDNENQYQRTFYDLINYLEDTENYILKALAAGSEDNLSSMLNEAWKSSVQAEACIALLPIDQNLMSGSSKYLVQLADMAKVWSEKSDGGLTDEEYDTLSDMYGYAQDLTGTFETMAVSVISGEDSWEDLSKISSEIFAGTEASEKYSYFNGLSTSFNDYPSMIYDGPFSDSAIKTFSGDIPGSTFSSEECSSQIKSFFYVMGEAVSTVDFSGESYENNLKLFNYAVEFTDGDTAYAAVTEDGGMIYSISMYTDIDSTKLNVDDAFLCGKEILKSMNISNMESSYYIIEGNCITVNYCYSPDGIMYYPDMIKIKLSLNDGSLLGYDAAGYIFNHYSREESYSTDEALLSEEAVKEYVSPKLECESLSLAVIQNDSGTEEFVYEVKCSGMGHDILVYIDASTGEEKDILILLEDEHGVLTV